MFRGFISFLIGVYAGVYLSQNYEIPQIDDPAGMLQKLKDLADKHKKD